MSAASPHAPAFAHDVSARIAEAGLDWLVPQWDAPRGVDALFTTRNAIGDHDVRTSSFDVGGAPGAPADAARRDAIAESRRSIRAFVPSAPVWLDQVHGAAVVDVDPLPRDAGDRWPRADAAVTRATDVVLAIRVADCLPALFAAADGAVIGAAHAGWRGLAAGVLENTVTAMRCDTAGIRAWLGPCISAAAYEVGDDVRDAFVAGDAGAACAFTPGRPGKWHADLAMLARRRLARAGVVAVTSAGLCTAADPARFYSYRRDRATGRMAALIWRVRC
jgi:YfiH family protein